MKLVDRNFNFEGRKGEKIWCVEAVSNDREEISKGIYECANEKEANEKCERMNKSSQDENIKFIVIRYLIEEDGFIAD